MDHLSGCACLQTVIAHEHARFNSANSLETSCSSLRTCRRLTDELWQEVDSSGLTGADIHGATAHFLQVPCSSQGICGQRQHALGVSQQQSASS